MHIVTMDAVTYVPHRDYQIDYVSQVDTMYAPMFSLNPDGMQSMLSSQAPIIAGPSKTAAESPLHSKILWAVAGVGVALLWATQNAH